MRTKNLLFAAQQTVSALTTQLHIVDEKLSTIEDLIGEVRTRMYLHGLPTHPIVIQRRQVPGPAPPIVSHITYGPPPCASPLFPISHQFNLTHNHPVTQPQNADN